MHERLAVYVPNPDATPRLRAQTSGIIEGSGIVGRPFPPGDPESPLLIYYEGDKYGSEQFAVYANRVSHAAGRMIFDAPTIARMLVRREAVKQVGWFYDKHGVEVEDAEGLMAIAKWLGYFKTGDTSFDSSALHRELRVTGSYTR